MGTNHPVAATFGMFFYGTLKRGQRNHGYCRGALEVRGATVRGSLYDLPEGYPALVVPENNILTVGTADPVRDAGADLGAGWKKTPAPEAPTVFGELYVFDDAAERLPAIDSLEGFAPGDPTSPYRRVLVPARTDGSTTAAWAYVASETRGRHLPGGRWPA
ncbi:MAG: hypothetical protein AVDCRST_MAG02-962 [uncultured Rubrobacteraceae bacterium]|uniref:Gamma-glutamylcyclotransferase AIG2-like domain-containing protein n=1 Tax=uncultured Rubrobacteraceae bacterium TaxID=349277 RepID=A0A6J4QUB5_9ACTN|nr:MAG: hypothetical protein AVDCRST_MAG02-962 [uncultured Rubrobacteraceae bacterium]